MAYITSYSNMIGDASNIPLEYILVMMRKFPNEKAEATKYNEEQL